MNKLINFIKKLWFGVVSSITICLLVVCILPAVLILMIFSCLILYNPMKAIMGINEGTLAEDMGIHIKDKFGIEPKKCK